MGGPDNRYRPRGLRWTTALGSGSSLEPGVLLKDRCEEMLYEDSLAEFK
jgi:hypothetical protein